MQQFLCSQIFEKLSNKTTVCAPNDYSLILSTSPSGQVKLAIIFAAVILTKSGLLKVN